MKRLLAIVLVLAGCSTVGVAPQAPDRTTRPVEITLEPAAPDDPTPVPVTDQVYRAGDLVTLTQDGEDWAEIVVSKVKQRSKYSGEYYDDVPGKGNIYIEMFVTYRALAQNVNYGLFDWQVYVNDTAIDNFAIVLNGPEPELISGSLPKGRKAQGWLVYEIPKSGRVVLSYASNMFSDDPPVFEVLLRGK